MENRFEMYNIKTEDNDYEIKEMEITRISGRSLYEGINCSNKSSSFCVPSQDGKEQFETPTVKIEDVDITEQFTVEMGIHNRNEYIIKSENNLINSLSQQIDNGNLCSTELKEKHLQENNSSDICDHSLAIEETVEQHAVFPLNVKQDEDPLGEIEVNHRNSLTQDLGSDYLNLVHQCDLHCNVENSKTNLNKRLDLAGPSKTPQVNETIRTTCDFVNFLINRQHFSSHSYEDKLYIIKEVKRPVPDLSKCLVTLGGVGKSNRGFQSAWYEKYDWLTGSVTLNKLFCWPCVLFATTNTNSDRVWSKSGYSDLKNLSRGLSLHNKSAQHISSNCKLTLMRKQNVATAIDNARRIEIQNFNARVKENRQILKSLIDITMHLCMQELRGDSLNRGNFKELVTLVSKFDTNLKTFLENDINSRSVFAGTSETIENELIDSVAFVANKRIEDEISKSLFFSWQVDETTDIRCRSQLSVIFRYVINDQLVERFMGFYDVSSGCSAEDLFQFLCAEFGKFDLHSKLVAQTYDGASVTSGELNDVQEKIKSIAPQATFTHCCAHVFDLVLSDACSSIQQVKVFFSTLSGFSSYFSESTKRTRLLEQTGGNRTPTTGWNFTSRAVRTVFDNRDKLLETFNFIIDSNSRDFDQTSIREAVGLKNFLEDARNIFFLETFALIFNQTDTLFSFSQNGNIDVQKAKNLLQTTLAKIREFRSNRTYFDAIYKKLNIVDLHSKRRKRVGMSDKAQQLRQIFFEILDITATQIEVRFCDIEKLHFFDLLNNSKFSVYEKEFPHELLRDLTTKYNIFDMNQLKCELTVLYVNDIIENCTNPYEMLTFFHDTDLKFCMPELFKLLCLVVVFPVTIASTETNFSALKRIENYVRNKTGRAPSSNMAKISIEKEFIKSQDENIFIDEVIDHFAEQKNYRIPLIYKKF